MAATTAMLLRPVLGARQLLPRCANLAAHQPAITTTPRTTTTRRARVVFSTVGSVCAPPLASSSRVQHRAMSCRVCSSVGSVCAPPLAPSSRVQHRAMSCGGATAGRFVALSPSRVQHTDHTLAGARPFLKARTPLQLLDIWEREHEEAGWQATKHSPFCLRFLGLF